jgi:predicted O-methyltransferase YrrM
MRDHLTQNPVLAEVMQTGVMRLADGALVPLQGHIGIPSARALRRSVEVTRPQLAIEVGLAFGVSTLHILDAMEPYGGMLIGMDPAQHDETWRGGGLQNVKRAGFADRYLFHEEASQVVLPRLAAAGTRIQFAFIDGWHTFDHTLVDFFFIDKMLDVGGIVVLDDVGYPSIRRLCHFILSNRRYSIVDIVRYPSQTLRQRLKRVAQAIVHRIVRDDFTPTSTTRAQQWNIASAELISLRKEGEDTRSFDHFVAF